MLQRTKFKIDNLVAEVLEQVPPEAWKSDITTFLDPAMGGGQFVKEIERRLRAHGHSDENIRERVWGVEEYPHRLLYAVNKNKLVGTHSVGDFLKEDFGDMKFDVVVGNPPFKQLADNGRQTNKSLWKEFLTKSSELLSNGGTLAMIHPSGWGAPSDNAKLISRLFTKMNLKFADVRTDLKKHFKGVSSTFSLTILKNEPYAGKTRVVYDEGEIDIDLRKTAIVTSSGMSIIKKITSVQNKCDFKLAGKNDHYAGEGYKIGAAVDGAVHKNIHQVNSSYDYEPGTTIPVRLTVQRSANTSQPKVVIPYNGPVNVIVDRGEYGIGWCQFMTIESDEIAGAEDVFTSNIFKFYSSQKHTQYNETKNLNLFPRLDLKRRWTNQELYDHFKLTKKEIEQIESSIK